MLPAAAKCRAALAAAAPPARLCHGLALLWELGSCDVHGLPRCVVARGFERGPSFHASRPTVSIPAVGQCVDAVEMRHARFKRSLASLNLHLHISTVSTPTERGCCRCSAH